MTPQEKAKELIDRFFCIEDDKDIFCDECGMSQEAAKQCALIAVDELIAHTPSENHMEAVSSNGNTAYRAIQCSDYWQQVKTEIEKL